MNGNVKMEKSKQLNILNNVRLDRGEGGRHFLHQLG